MNPSLLAHIREQDCIGCTKCIQACPYDSIIGTAKYMHTVLITECTGCGDCIAPCPVDCIDLIPRESANQKTISSVNSLPTEFDPIKAETRRLARDKRLAEIQELKAQQQTNAINLKNSQQTNIIAARKTYILEAIKRAKLKKTSGNR